MENSLSLICFNNFEYAYGFEVYVIKEKVKYKKFKLQVGTKRLEKKAMKREK